MTTRWPRLSVLLPTYRQPEILVLTLRDLGMQNYPSDLWELIIIDDGSGDNSAGLALLNLADKVDLTVKWLTSGGLYSHAKLFNEMIRLSSSKSEAFVHVEDVRVRSDYLLQHAKWHRTADAHLITGPMCESAEETFDPSTCSRWPLMQMSGAISKAYRCCFQTIFAKSMSYPRFVADKLNAGNSNRPFDESMIGWGYHETDFAYRAERSGVSLVYDADCAVFHPRHNARDESQYREFDRSQTKSDGETRNINHICAKYGLRALPEWKVGAPMASPEIEFG